MLKYYKIEQNRLIETDQNQSLILIATAPDNSEQALIREQFYLDEFDLASSLDVDEVPRLDITSERLLLVWKIPLSAKVSDTIELGVTVIGFVIAKDRIAIIAPKSDISLEEREFRSIGNIIDVIFSYLLNTVRHFVAHLRIIKQISAELEKKITMSLENKYLLSMFDLSESLVYYADAIEGNSAVLARLRNIAPNQGFHLRQLEILDDIILENSQAARQAHIYSSVLSGLMDARGTIVNNNMNVLLKNLTLINIVFLPLNLIASIGGMSEWSMMTQGINWKISYAIFGAAMVGLGLGTWFFMKKFIEKVPRHMNRKL